MHLQEVSQEPTYLEQQSDSIVDWTFVLCDANPVLKNISRCLWSLKTMKKNNICVSTLTRIKKKKKKSSAFSVLEARTQQEMKKRNIICRMH